MSKKREPKSQPTDEELRIKAARNEQVRFRTLTAWYKDASGTNEEARLGAQARLYLQLQLRNIRKKRDALAYERDCFKASGDIEGAKAIKEKLIPIYKMLRPLYLLRDGINENSKAKMAKKWKKECMPLDELLKHGELDLQSDFPADNNIDPTNDNIQPVKIEATLHETRIEDDDNCASVPTVLTQEKKDIWNYHEQSMRKHFVEMGWKQHMIDTRIAVQKSAFMSQAKREFLVNQAHVTLLELCSQNKCVPIGYAEFVSPTGGLWILSSTKFWKIHQGRKEWEQYKWEPGGYLRISTASGISHLHFDFGGRSFTTGPTILPLLATPYPLAAFAFSETLGIEFKFEISFLGDATLKIRCPTHLLLADGEDKTMSLVDTHVEFVGVFSDLDSDAKF